MGPLVQSGLSVRPGDHFDGVAGGVLDIDAASAVLGVGLARARHLRIGPVLDTLGLDAGVSPVEEVVWLKVTVMVSPV